jgi:hypothetical protein
VTIVDEILERNYAELGDERVSAHVLTRGEMRRGSKATGCVHMLWMTMADCASAHRVRPLPVAALSPNDEAAKEWVDRCIALVRDWRIHVERGVQR